jgi:D-alanyl-D-alanine carboxypeptidase
VSASLSQLIPELQEPARALVDAAGSARLNPRVTSTYRSFAEQTRLYRRYLSGLQSLPVAPPGTSAHEFGYAFDMIVTPFEALRDVGYTWRQWGGVWGGEFNDPVHFEYPGFKASRQGDSWLSAAIRQLSDWYGNLPGWSTIFLPLALTATSSEDLQRTVNAWLDSL